MCGIAGYIGKRDVISTIIFILLELQHRGQEAAGIAVATKKGLIYSFAGKGLVLEALSPENISELYKVNDLFGGIGHVRYATCGGYLDSQTQPVVVGDNGFRIAVAFNEIGRASCRERV